jgi:histidine ammonia-lyase
MGTNAALMAKKVIQNTFEVLAIEYLAIIQAIDYLSFENKLASTTKKAYLELRKIVPVFTEDTPRYTDLEKIKEYLLASTPKIIY